MRRAIHITLRYGNNEAEVRFHKTLTRLFVALLGALRKIAFFIFRKKRRLADLLQIHLHRVRNIIAKVHGIIQHLDIFLILRKIDECARFNNFDTGTFQSVIDLVK